MASEDRDTDFCDVGRGAPHFSSVEFAESVNSINANPLVQIEFLRDPTYVTSDGEACRADLATFLENVKPLGNPPRRSDMLRRSARHASASFVSPHPARAVDLPALVSPHFAGLSAYGEMYWCSKSFPIAIAYTARLSSRRRRPGAFSSRWVIWR